jgi:hypothetical protein
MMLNFTLEFFPRTTFKKIFTTVRRESQKRR